MPARFLSAALALLLGVAFAAPSFAAPALYGVWRNPKNSVHVQIRDCETGACGYVVWASDNARADAREGSGKELIGMRLFHSFTQDANQNWRGRVYVPDLNKTFSGSARLSDNNTLKARGCLIGNVLCKAQSWTRVGEAPN